MRIILLYLILGALCTSSAYGHSMSDTIRIAEVSVNSNKIRAKQKYVYDSLRIANAIHQDLSKFLQENSSIQFKVYGSSGSAVMSIRGANAAHSKVKWNGMDLGSPMLNQNDVSLLAVSNADEISLVRGGSTATQGTGALAGYINLKTNPSFNAQKLGVYANYNSIDNRSVQLNFNTGSAAFASHTSINVLDHQNNFSFENYSEANSPTQNQINSDWKKFCIIQSFFYHKNKSELELHTWYQESDRQLSPPIFNRQKNSYQFDNAFRNNLQYTYRLNSKHALKANVSYTRERIRFVSRTKQQNTTLVLFNTNSYFDQVQHNLSYAYTSDKLQQEFAYQYNFEGAYVEDYSGYRTRNRLAISSNTEYSVIKWFTLQFANRIEQVNDDQIFATSLNLSTNKWYRYGIVPYVKMSRNYNLPGLNDLYWIPGGNENLKPEKSFEQEIGLNIEKSYAKFSWAGDLKVYHSLVDDWILWQPSTIENGLWTPQNLLKVKLQGVEFNIDFIYNIRSYHRIALKTFFAHNSATNERALSANDNSVGKQLIYTPVQKWGINLQYSYKSYQLMVNQHQVSHRFTTSDESLFLPSYYLVDLSIQKSFTHQQHYAQVGVYADNIFNQAYESLPFQAMPARVLGIKLTYQLNTYKKQLEK